MFKIFVAIATCRKLVCSFDQYAKNKVLLYSFLCSSVVRFIPLTPEKLRCSQAAHLKMHRNTIWYKSLLGAEKSCLKDEKIKKVHYKFEDEKEMVEEYNVDTQVMLRRAWKVKGKLGGEGKWEVEVGDSIPDATPNNDALDIMESKDQVSAEFC